MTLEEMLRLHAAIFNHKEMETHFLFFILDVEGAEGKRARLFPKSVTSSAKISGFLEERSRMCEYFLAVSQRLSK